MTSTSKHDLKLGMKGDQHQSGKWKHSAGDSSFSSFRPVTILTNLQRGNVETKQDVPITPTELNFHNKVAMGEICSNDFTPAIDVNAFDSNSLTPLMWAAFYGQLPAVRLLIQHNALVDIEGKNGETALMHAASGGHHEICRLLLSCKADPNKVDNRGNTGLMYAVFSDSAHCVSELLESGAEASLTEANFDGETAYSIAVGRKKKRAQLVIERFLLRLFPTSS